MRKLRANLLHKFCCQFVVSEEEAIKKAGLDDMFFESDMDTMIASDSVGVLEDSVFLEQSPNATVGDCGLRATTKEDTQPSIEEKDVPTLDKWIVSAYSDDDESFRRRLEAQSMLTWMVFVVSRKDFGLMRLQTFSYLMWYVTCGLPLEGRMEPPLNGHKML
ncbi:hypothetical protein R1sor_004739 [Riccia sorocarpa]|uniref:Uncharacterized protein n=1 Tax=Riccia sorocarpa TaxID=122646 RepID=A0ABD3HI42_9MARC